MSIEDDEYDLDDDVLDGMFEDDLEDDLDDFDELEDEGMSFDEDDVLFDDDDDDEDGMGGGADDGLIGAEKKKFAIDIGFDKIVILGAVIVGIIVLVFQVTTKKPISTEEVFQSALTMKGATDGEVFGQSQTKDITQSAPQNQKDQKAFLYEPDALNVLPNNLKDGVIVKDLEIAPVQNPAPAKKESRFVSTRPTSNNNSEGQFVSASSGEVLKSQMDFIPDDVAPARDAPQENNFVPTSDADFEKDLMELEGRNVEPAQENILERQETQVQTDLNFVPINDVIEPKEKTIETRVQDQQQTQAMESEMAQLRNEVAALKREKEKLAQQARAEKEALRKMEASQKRLADEKRAAEEKARIASAKAQAVQKEAERAKRLAAQKTVTPKAVTPKVVAPPKVKDKKPAPVIWEMRAAQPGKAWISEKGKQDIIAVTVGSNVRGLGTVSSIIIQDGRWVVVGSNGRVQQ